MRNLSPAVLLLALACNSDKSLGPSSLTGTWSFSANITNSAPSVSCTEQETVEITQSGTAFYGMVTSGSQTCIIGGVSETASIPARSPFSGQFGGSSMSLDDWSGCAYTGTVSGNPINRMNGDIDCPLTVSGANYNVVGTWQATR